MKDEEFYFNLLKKINKMFELYEMTNMESFIMLIIAISDFYRTANIKSRKVIEKIIFETLKVNFENINNKGK